MPPSARPLHTGSIPTVDTGIARLAGAWEPGNSAREFMVRAYFILNAVLYAGFAAWCTIAHGTTSRASGYVSLDSAGHSEYLVIYGGLQLGLALFFVYLATQVSVYRAGAVFSTFLYGAIVVYRIVTVMRYWPVANLTVGIAVLELLLLVGALIALAKTKLN